MINVLNMISIHRLKNLLCIVCVCVCVCVCGSCCLLRALRQKQV